MLIAEHDNKALKDATHKALTAAKALGADVHVLVAGRSCRPVAEAAANLEGVKKVVLTDKPAYEHMLAEPMAALVVATRRLAVVRGDGDGGATWIRTTDLILIRDAL